MACANLVLFCYWPLAAANLSLYRSSWSATDRYRLLVCLYIGVHGLPLKVSRCWSIPGGVHGVLLTVSGCWSIPDGVHGVLLTVICCWSIPGEVLCVLLTVSCCWSIPGGVHGLFVGAVGGGVTRYGARSAVAKSSGVCHREINKASVASWRGKNQKIKNLLIIIQQLTY